MLYFFSHSLFCSLGCFNQWQNWLQDGSRRYEGHWVQFQLCGNYLENHSCYPTFGMLKYSLLLHRQHVQYGVLLICFIGSLPFDQHLISVVKVIIYHSENQAVRWALPENIYQGMRFYIFCRERKMQALCSELFINFQSLWMDINLKFPCDYYNCGVIYCPTSHIDSIVPIIYSLQPWQ